MPEIQEFNTVKNNLEEVMDKIKNRKYTDFKLDDTDFVNEFTLSEDLCPRYIHKAGVESLTYFEFKKNSAYREMQIINLKYYILFMYNTLNVYNDLFNKLYTENEYKPLIDNSNSYVIFDDLFWTDRDYEGQEIDVAVGKFAVRNNKTTGQLAYERNSSKYLEKQSTYLCSVKVG